MANSAVAIIGVLLLIAAAGAYFYTVPASSSVSALGVTVSLTQGEARPYLQYAFPLAVGGFFLLVVGIAGKR